MKSPVYRFSDVLRALRNESDLTVLRAAELTGYSNYERWESGQTKVRPEYLETLAGVFRIEGDLWLLAYAWLVDRYTPKPGGRFVEFTPQRLSVLLRRLPTGEVDLGEHGDLAVRAIGHGQLAIMCLIARYRASYAGADVPLVLAPTPRTPAPCPDRSGYILDRYVSVVGDLARYVARTFLLAGLGQLQHEVAVAVFRHVFLLLAEPEPFASLAGPSDASRGTKLRGLHGLPGAAARSLPKLRQLAVRQLEDLCRLSASAQGRDVTVEEVQEELRACVHDDELWDSLAELDADKIAAALTGIADDERLWLSTEDWPVAHVASHLADPDPELLAELQRLHDQFDRRCRRAIREEVADATATADPRAALDASIMLRRETTTH